jgi:serine/threonine-protein kinase HipA
MTDTAVVWFFPPGQTTPVHCGRLLVLPAGFIEFRYAAAYLGRAGVIPLHPLTLDLSPGGYVGRRIQALPHAIADAAPDAWGRRVIEHRSGAPALNELDYLLAGAGHRAGAMHFQRDESEYRPVDLPVVAVRDLAEAAALLEQNVPLPPELEDALLHGTSIGGARPKAAIADDVGHWIAKFSSRTDRYDVVRFEYATMKLAAHCGIDVPEVRLVETAGKHVLLVHRFDRVPKDGDYSRRLVLSALSLLQLDDTEARLAGYPDFAEVLRQWSREPLNDCKQLFRRMLFNMLVGNTDDHAKNHAVFWDGQRLALTPAYDLMPIPRTGQEGRQAMRVGELGPMASLTNAYSEAARFGLLAEEARGIVGQLRDRFAGWREQFEAAGLDRREYERLAGTVIDSPAVLR